MKYIDAEKLIAEINNRIMSVNLEELGNFGSHRVWAYNDVKDLISSLQQEQSEVSVECYVRVYPTLDDKPREWVSLCKHGIDCNSIRDIPELETLGFKDDDTAIVTIARKNE